MQYLYRLKFPNAEDFFTKELLDRLEFYRLYENRQDNRYRVENHLFHDVVKPEYHNYMGVDWYSAGLFIHKIDGGTFIHVDDMHTDPNVPLPICKPAINLNLFDKSVMEFYTLDNLVEAGSANVVDEGDPEKLNVARKTTATIFEAIGPPAETVEVNHGDAFVFNTLEPHRATISNNRMLVTMRSKELSYHPFEYTLEKLKPFMK
jgi:hypothetical protein